MKKLKKFRKGLENHKKSIICTDTRESDSCRGDSGGPLFRKEGDNWVIYGLASFGYGCGTGVPAIYTNVNHFKDWIEMMINMIDADELTTLTEPTTTIKITTTAKTTTTTTDSPVNLTTKMSISQLMFYTRYTGSKTSYGDIYKYMIDDVDGPQLEGKFKMPYPAKLPSLTFNYDLKMLRIL